MQQKWIKASQADLRGVQNIAGWLTTVIARECFDRLRAQQRRGERCLPDEVEAGLPVLWRTKWCWPSPSVAPCSSTDSTSPERVAVD